MEKFKLRKNYGLFRFFLAHEIVLWVKIMLFKMYLAHKNVDCLELMASIKVDCSHIWIIFAMILLMTNHTLRSVIGHHFNNCFLFLPLCNKVINPLVTLRGKCPFWIEDYTILMYPIPMANHTLWKTSTAAPSGPRPLPLAIAFKVTNNYAFVMGWVKLHFMYSWILSFRIFKKNI